MRITARGLVVLWAGFWIFFAVASVLSEGISTTGFWVVCGMILVFGGSAGVGWTGKPVAAWLLIAEGLVVLIGYPLWMGSQFPVITIVSVILTMAVPPLVSGSMMLILWQKSRVKGTSPPDN